MAGLLPTLVTSLDLTFQATQFPAALATLAAASDLVAETPEARPALHGAFLASASLLARVFQVPPHQGSEGEQQGKTAAKMCFSPLLLLCLCCGCLARDSAWGAIRSHPPAAWGGTSCLCTLHSHRRQAVKAAFAPLL